MSKTELETIALDCLSRLEAVAKTTHQSQDEKIHRIERRVEDFERQLTRLSTSLQSLRPLTDSLKNILPSSGKR
jgi:archaellum component FlaC